MCVRLRQWPIDRIKRSKLFRREIAEAAALAIVQVSGGKQLVVMGCLEARKCGVRQGMTLAEARALCAGLVWEPYEPEKDRKGLEALARWMIRFSPAVQVVGEDAIAMEVGGGQRLFGSIERIMQLASEGLKRFGIWHGIAIAPTVGASWGLASFEKEKIVSSLEEIQEALRPLPVAALRLEEEVIDDFARLGIETVGQLMELPRETLPSRFGAMVLNRLDQALGVVAEPMVAMEQEEPVVARLDFDGVIESLETIWEAFRVLLEQVAVQLKRRGCGARKVVVELMVPSYSSSSYTLARYSGRGKGEGLVGNPKWFALGTMPSPQPSPGVPGEGEEGKTSKTILLSRPTRNVKGLLNLIKCALERVEEECDDGFTGVRLSVPVMERVSDEQLRLLGEDIHDSEIQVDHLLERLRVRLGQEAAVCPQLVESHLPERAFRCVPTVYAGAGLRARPDSPKEKKKGRLGVLPVQKNSRSRPLHLLAGPVEVRCTSIPTEDAEGRPIVFASDEGVHQVAQVRGPERICGVWWEGRFKTRDYFEVEDSTGRRFWLFRVAETRRWYLHGIFDG